MQPLVVDRALHETELAGQGELGHQRGDAGEALELPRAQAGGPVEGLPTDQAPEWGRGHVGYIVERSLQRRPPPLRGADTGLDRARRLHSAVADRRIRPTVGRGDKVR